MEDKEKLTTSQADELKEEMEEFTAEDLEAIRNIPLQTIDLIKNAETIRKFLKKENKTPEEEELAKALRLMFYHLTDQTIYVKNEILPRLQKENIKLTEDIPPKDEFKELGENLSIRDHIQSLQEEGLDTDVLSSDQVRYFLAANDKGIKKVLLPNSGFFVVIQEPVIRELNLLFNQLAEDTTSFGRMLGAYYFLYNDFIIKQTMAEFLHKLIINSNLKGFSKYNTFAANLSIHDLPVLLHAIATMMFKDGYEFTYVCPHCKHQEKTLVDLEKFRWYNFEYVDKDLLKMLFDTNKKSPQDAAKYRKYLVSLLPNNIVEYENFKFHMKIPTLKDYIDAANIFLKDMMEVVSLKDKDKVDSFIAYNFLKVFLPWIEYVEVKSTKTNKIYKIFDNEGKMAVLDHLQTIDPNTIHQKFKSFMDISSLTLICYPINPCPKCGKTPDNAVNGFIPFDMVHNFFILSSNKLIQKP